VQQSFTVKRAQTITFTSAAPAAAVYQGASYTPTATADSALAVTLSIDTTSGAVCSLAGATVSFTGTGTCTINANQGGDTSNYPALQVQQSFSVGPNLVADAYSALGNTQLVANNHSLPTTPYTSSGSNVLQNDLSNAPIAVTAVTNATTTGGGVITLDASGRFTYTPPAGRSTGTDTYAYTGTSNGVSRTGTITLNIADIVWYVDRSSSGAHDGRSNSPFLDMGGGANNLGSALSNAGPAAGAYIYVYKGNAAYTGSYTFKANQKLIGAGADLTVPGVAPPVFIAGSLGNTPMLNTSLALASGVSITGLDMDGTAASLSGGSITGFSVNLGRFRRTASGSAITLGGTGNTGTFAFKSVSATGGTKGVSISNLNGQFFVAGTDTGVAPEGGTISGYGSNGMEFIGVTNGGLTAVSLTKMTLNGNGVAQTVAGNSSACGFDLRGGTNTSCVANLFLQNTTGVVLDAVSVTGSGQMGINGNGVTTFSMTGSSVTGNGTEPFENGITFQNLFGTASITDSTIRNNAARQIHVTNLQNNSNLTFNITGTRTQNAYPVMDTSTTTIGNTPASGTYTQQGLLLESSSGTNVSMTLNVNGVAFPNNSPGNAVDIQTLAPSGTLGGTTQNSSFDTNAGGVIISLQNGSNATYNVTNNEFNHSALQSILYAAANPTSGTLQGTIENNTIGTAGQSGSACFPTAGSNCHGIDLNFVGGTGAIQARIRNNVVQQFGGFGIKIQANGAGAMHANVNSNTVGPPLGSFARGINTNIGTTAGATIAGCFGITGNTLLGSFEDPGLGAPLGIAPQVRFLATHRLPGYVGAARDTAAVNAYILGNNPGAAGKIFAQVGNNTAPNNPTYMDGSACTTPF
jgi:hypothetical protein